MFAFSTTITSLLQLVFVFAFQIRNLEELEELVVNLFSYLTPLTDLIFGSPTDKNYKLFFWSSRASVC